jgi:hypothetical protein
VLALEVQLPENSTVEGGTAMRVTPEILGVIRVSRQSEKLLED